ncbi:two-component fusion protein, partial [Candidatus Magnetomorum sp. HK-1]
EKGKILNSEICSYLGVSTRDIGSHTSPESTLTIGVDPSLLKQVKEYEAQIAEKNKELEKVKEESKIPDDVTEKLEQIISTIGPLKESVEKTEAIRPALVQKLEAAKKKGNKKELKQTIKMIQEIETKFQAAKKNLAQLIEERETLEKDLGVLPEIEAAIAEFQTKLDEVNELILDDRQSAPIKVTGNVYRGTIIKGVHSELEMKDDENKVVIQEIYKVDEEDKVESVIISEPLTEKEKK